MPFPAITAVMEVINGREVQKNTNIKCKGQYKDKISVSKRIHIFSCTTMIAKHLT